MDNRLVDGSKTARNADFRSEKLARRRRRRRRRFCCAPLSGRPLSDRPFSSRPSLTLCGVSGVTVLLWPSPSTAEYPAYSAKSGTSDACISQCTQSAADVKVPTHELYTQRGAQPVPARPHQDPQTPVYTLMYLPRCTPRSPAPCSQRKWVRRAGGRATPSEMMRSERTRTHTRRTVVVHCSNFHCKVWCSSGRRSPPPTGSSGWLAVPTTDRTGRGHRRPFMSINLYARVLPETNVATLLLLSDGVRGEDRQSYKARNFATHEIPLIHLPSGAYLGL